MRMAKGTERIAQIIGEPNPQVQLSLALAALENINSAAEPYNWALLNGLVGCAFLQHHDEVPERIERAEEHFEKALSVFTREAFPVEWAVTHANFGTLYLLHGRNLSDWSEEAIKHYALTLTVVTRANSPEQWVEATLNLAMVYRYRSVG